MFPVNRFTRNVLTVLIDSLAVIFSFFGAYYIRVNAPLFEHVKETPLYPYVDILPFVLIISLFSFHYFGLYRHHRRSLIDSLPAIFLGTGLAALILILITFIFKMYPFSRIILFLFWLMTIFCLWLWRLLVKEVLKVLNSKGIGLTNAVIVGTGKVPELLAQQLVLSGQTGYKLLGFIVETERKDLKKVAGYPVLATIEEFEKILPQLPCQDIFIASTELSASMITEWTYLCAEHNIRLNYLPNIQELLVSSGYFTELFGIPLIVVEGQFFKIWNQLLKRAVDLILSLILLVILSPLWLVMILLIKLDYASPGPILYFQERIGKRGRRFRMIKFRSMRVDAEKEIGTVKEMNIAKGPLFKIPRDPRITKAGRLMRRFSLDELPQLINVLKNEMSLVGPRPALPVEVDQYSESHKKRLQIQPGITGLWQVNGRSDLTFDEMVNLDLYYIEHWSVWMDVKILLKTCYTVISGKGAY